MYECECIMYVFVYDMRLNCYRFVIIYTLRNKTIVSEHKNTLGNKNHVKNIP